MTILYNGNPDGLLTYTSPSPKLCMGPSGTYRYGPHNLYVDSASPANQSITVVSGAAYTVVITGSVSVTASGAATGTWTSGTTTFTAATGTLTLGSTSGAGTVHVRRTNADSTYLETRDEARYGLPYQWNSSGVLQGILVEEAGTNVALWGTDFTNAVWSVTSMTAAKTATGPDGIANSATTLTATGANGTILQSITSASASRVSSVFVKRRTGSGTIEITQDNGATWTAVTVTSSWTRVSLAAATVTNPIVGFRIGTSGDAIDAHWWVTETGAFITSPIETFGATVTRAGDDITLATSAFPALGSAFGMVIEVELIGDSSVYPHIARIYEVDNKNIASTFINPLLDTKLYAEADDVVSADLSSGVTITRGVSYKQAVSYEANRFAISVNGAAVKTDASGAVPSGMTTLALGGKSAMRIRKLLVVPHRYSDGQLQSLSA